MNTPTLIDIGCNLCHSRFDHDRTQVLQRACAQGVTQIIITGVDAQSSADGLALARQHPGYLYATAGIHPHDAAAATDDDLQRLRQLLNDPQVVAVGETGLDFNRDYSPRERQITIFEQQLQLAADTGKPLFLHERDAFDVQYSLLRQWRHHISRAVIHCFTGSREQLLAWLDLDLHIGITGWVCDERRGLGLRELIPLIPGNRLMLESDAPFLLPRDLPEKVPDRRNEPAFLPHIAQTLALLRNEPLAALATTLTATTREFFSINADGCE